MTARGPRTELRRCCVGTSLGILEKVVVVAVVGGRGNLGRRLRGE